jgi:hypothetical protein
MGRLKNPYSAGPVTTATACFYMDLESGSVGFFLAGLSPPMSPAYEINLALATIDR